jgi:alpha-tubulin suppressor-like RCC1 family protein
MRDGKPLVNGKKRGGVWRKGAEGRYSQSSSDFVLIRRRGLVLIPLMPWLSCGSGSAGVLFSGDAADCETLGPTAIRSRGVVACGGRHSIALTCPKVAADVEGHESGDADVLVGVGDNAQGQLTGALPEAVLRPQYLASGLVISKVALGWEFTAVLTRDGRVFCCGRGDDGQLGLGEGVIKSADLLLTTGFTARDIACSRSHALALSVDGAVFSWGSSRHGLQPGNASAGNVWVPQALGAVNGLLPGARRFTRVVCGWQHSAALTEDGCVVTWGSNRYGQCGSDPALSGRVAPPAMVMDRSGRTPLHSITALSSGWSHMAALAYSSAGALLLTWGRSDLGQLGRPSSTAGATTSSTTPVCASPPPAPPPWAPSPVQLRPRSTRLNAAIHTSAPEGCALSPPARSTCTCCTGQASIPCAIACGAEHSVCVAACGCAFAWGWNEHGNLGLGDRVSREVPERMSGTGCCQESQRRALDAVAAGAVSFVLVDAQRDGDTACKE